MAGLCLLIAGLVALLRFLEGEEDETLNPFAGESRPAGGRSLLPGSAPGGDTRGTRPPGNPRPPGDTFVLEGEVRDEGNNPVASARVVLVPKKAGSGMPGGRSFQSLSTIHDTIARRSRLPWPEVTTPQDGKFAFFGTARGTYFLVVQHSSFRYHHQTLQIVDRTSREIVLKKGLAVGGRVSDTEGNPVSGIAVAGYQETGDPGGSFMLSQRTRSAGDGSFLLPGFRAGPVLVAPELPAGADLRILGEKKRKVTAGDTGLEILLLRFGRVAFKARVRSTDTPVPGIRTAEIVEGNPPEGITAFRVIPENQTEGKYFIKAPPGRWRVRLEAPRLGIVEAEFEARGGERTEIAEPLYFGGYASLKGRVRLPSGNYGDRPAVFLERLDVAGFTAGCRTDEEGKFAFTDLESGRYRIVVLLRGLGTLEREERLEGEHSVTYALDGSATDQTPGPAKYTFSERRNLRVFFDVRGFTIEEVAWWLRRISGAGIGVSPELAQKLNSQGTRVTLTLQSATLESVVRTVTRLRGVDFDETAGEFVVK
jgi:protocatechuate 3,4-dioxygenase beta subunit